MAFIIRLNNNNYKLFLENVDTYENTSRSGIWISILFGVVASVGSLAVVLFSIYVKER